MKIFTALLILLSLFFPPDACALETHQEHEEHNHHIGFLIGAVYNVTEEKYMLGLGFEYERVLPLWDGLFGIGVAGEVVFDEHRHYVASLLIPIHPIRKITFFLAPGIMFIEQEKVERYFSIHFGVEYEFELEKIFLAPEFEVAIAGDDIHLMLGVHIGFGW